MDNSIDFSYQSENADASEEANEDDMEAF